MDIAEHVSREVAHKLKVGAILTASAMRAACHDEPAGLHAPVCRATSAWALEAAPDRASSCVDATTPM